MMRYQQIFGSKLTLLRTGFLLPEVMQERGDGGGGGVGLLGKNHFKPFSVQLSTQYSPWNSYIVSLFLDA